MLVEIVKLQKEEIAAVTSLDIAETFDKEHRGVLRDIRELDCSDDFRLHNFVQSTYINEQSHKQPCYYITRDGFVFLVMGYRGEKAAKFKEAYIKREKGIAVRQALTKALQQSGEDERMHHNGYSNYTNCIYKVLFGKNTKQLREQYNIGKCDSLRDCFTREELRAVQSMECLVSGLLDCGWGYDRIKEFIEKNNAQRQIAA